MKTNIFSRSLLAAAMLLTPHLRAADLNIRLQGSPQVQRSVTAYVCDDKGVKLGLPANRFEVEYINAGPNSLAILPVSGQSLIFAGVSSGSGARYAAGSLIWWEAAGRGITLTSDALDGNTESSCRRIR